MRKAAVFCIVKLYFVMGEEKVKPKFALLNASKVRYDSETLSFLTTQI